MGVEIGHFAVAGVVEEDAEDVRWCRQEAMVERLLEGAFGPLDALERASDCLVMTLFELGADLRIAPRPKGGKGRVGAKRYLDAVIRG